MTDLNPVATARLTAAALLEQFLKVTAAQMHPSQFPEPTDDSEINLLLEGRWQAEEIRELIFTLATAFGAMTDMHPGDGQHVISAIRDTVLRPRTGSGDAP